MTNVAGIDWASEEHALCVVDEAGTRLRERVVAHAETGMTMANTRNRMKLRRERLVFIGTGDRSCLAFPRAEGFAWAE